MLVLAQVSSRNTSLAGSRPGWRSRHSSRACCTSARSCSVARTVFFKTEPPLVQLVPQPRRLDLHAPPGDTIAQLGQCQVWLGLEPAAYCGFQMRHLRAPVAAHRQAGVAAGLPVALGHLVDPHPADFQALGDLGWTLAALYGPKHPVTQILRICLHTPLPLRRKGI